MAKFIYVATGNTYQHRELLTSWAWHWDQSRKAWVEDNGSDDDEPCITEIQSLDGIVIEKIPIKTDSWWCCESPFGEHEPSCVNYKGDKA